MATVRDILMNADAFRRAYPSWPHATRPENAAPLAALRDSLIRDGWHADSPRSLSPEAERLARLERQD